MSHHHGRDVQSRYWVVGGSGNLGRAAARVLVALGHGARTTLVARNPERLLHASRRLGLSRPPVCADARRLEAADLAISPGDVVINAVSSIHAVGAAVLRAALHAGAAAYVDAYDESDAVRDVLALRGHPGLQTTLCITGLGLAPGLSNALAVIATRRLDAVAQIVAGWPLPRLRGGVTEPLSGWSRLAAELGDRLRLGSVMQHLWRCLVQPGWVVIDGRPMRAAHSMEALCLEGPSNVAMPCWTVDSPEPLMLANRFPTLARAVSVFTADATSQRLLSCLVAQHAGGRLSDAGAHRALMAAAVSGALSGARTRHAGTMFVHVSGTMNRIPTTVVEQLDVKGRLEPAHAGAMLGLAASGRLAFAPSGGILTVQDLPDPAVYIRMLEFGGHLIKKPVRLQLLSSSWPAAQNHRTGR